MIDAQIEYYSQLYAQTEDPRTPDLAQAMREVSQDIPKNWLFFKIDPGKVKMMSNMMLYYQGSAAQVFDAWASAYEGDPSGLALMSLGHDVLVPGMFVYVASVIIALAGVVVLVATKGTLGFDDELESVTTKPNAVEVHNHILPEG